MTLRALEPTASASFGVAGLGPADVLMLALPLQEPPGRPCGACWVRIDEVDPERLLQIELWVGPVRQMSIRSMSDGRGRPITAGELLLGVSCYSRRRGMSIDLPAGAAAAATSLHLWLDVRRGVPTPRILFEP